MYPITMSVNDAARAIGIGRTTLYRLIREGRVIAIKLGKRTLIRAESLHDLVKVASVGPVPPIERD